VKQSIVLGITDLGRLAKPAALLFDKVFCHKERAEELGIPDEVIFYDPEVEKYMLEQVDWHATQEFLGLLLNPSATKEALAKSTHGLTLRMIARGHAKCGIRAVPLYHSEAAFSADFSPGEGVAYQAVLNNIPVAEATELDWRQILEFRGDVDALRRYRALRAWMQEALASTSLSEATDIVGAKLEDYEWALRKHGLRSVLGAISEVLDSKTIAAATAAGGLLAVLSQSAWALLTSGALVISKVAVYVAERKIEAEDLRRGENTAIATIHEIRRLASEGRDVAGSA
jgi:hypothetical protein